VEHGDIAQCVASSGEWSEREGESNGDRDRDRYCNNNVAVSGGLDKNDSYFQFKFFSCPPAPHTLSHKHICHNTFGSFCIPFYL
jgi:hypothetical protein